MMDSCFSENFLMFKSLKELDLDVRLVTNSDEAMWQYPENLQSLTLRNLSEDNLQQFFNFPQLLENLHMYFTCLQSANDIPYLMYGRHFLCIGFHFPSLELSQSSRYQEIVLKLVAQVRFRTIQIEPLYFMNTEDPSFRKQFQEKQH